MSDVDFSFGGQSEERSRVAEIKKQINDHRRRIVRGKDPHEKTVSPWSVKEKSNDDTPPWTFMIEEGKISRFIENVLPGTIGIFSGGGGTTVKSIFELEVIEACSVGGEHADIGTLIRCFGATALTLIGAGRVRVIEEIRPSATDQ